jgi:hypothetical protein
MEAISIWNNWVKRLALGVVAICFLAGSAKASPAADLSTASVFVSAEDSFCTATNLGKGPVDVTVDVFDALTGDTLDSFSCKALGAKRACTVEFFNNTGLDRFVFCHITSSGKLRGLMMVQSGISSDAR